MTIKLLTRAVINGITTGAEGFLTALAPADDPVVDGAERLTAAEEQLEVLEGVDTVTPYVGDNIINVSTWTRLPEVDTYAAWRKISRGRAVRELVNSALSHGLHYR